MKIAYLTAGAAGMYCGSCLNDNMLARTLGKMGHEALLIPTYTPIRTDEENVSLDRVFFGGINVYLQQKFRFFRKTPWLIDRLFNSKPMLALASRLSGSTDARMLGEMTIAVLEGNDGPLKKELDKLVAWLAESYQPDVVHLTNAMFVGLAGRLKRDLGVVVTCGLPGEDLFLDALVEPYRSKAMAILQRSAQSVDAFTAPSPYYQAYMAPYLAVAPERIHLVDLGLDLDPSQQPEPLVRNPSQPLELGFLARRAPEKGLDVLVDAFIRLAQIVGPTQVRLHVAGYLAPQNTRYFQEQVEKVAQAGLGDQVRWVGEVDGPGKEAFFRGLHLFSMPAAYHEPKGRSVLEAMAFAVPVVQPDHGAFSEMLRVTQGGLLVQPEDLDALVAGLLSLYRDEPLRQQLAVQGRSVVRQQFTAFHTAERMLATWTQLLADRSGTGLR